MKLLLLFALTCGFLRDISAFKMLVITSMPAHSHFTLAFRLAEELAIRDHQVTFVSPYPQKTPIKNLREVSLADTLPFVDGLRKRFSEHGTWGSIGTHFIDWDLSHGITEHALNNTGVRKLINSKETFDVVIIEHFINEALVGLGYLFKAPVILLAPVPSCYRNNYIYGNPGPSSYVPDLLGTYTKHMDFWQRLKNFIMVNLHEVVREINVLPLQRRLFKKYITSEVELEDLLHNVSLILTTSHPSVNDAVPHLPNIIEIGGYHVSPPKKLPQDLQKFLDNAKDGVVLFSMGSNVKSKDLSLDVRKAILNSFSRIKAKVLWKFETDLPEAPKNVKILPWLPQQDILSHPNVKCFITHGGLLSNIEAVYYGVPLIGIPLFADQFNNLATAESSGYARKLPLNEITEETFFSALNDILTNPKYMNAVKQRSRAMHDQPLKPTDLAVYWIEHVIRNGGAPHLRSSVTDLKWYQRELIDVIAFLCVVVLVILVMSCKILSWMVRRLCCGKDNKTKTVVSTKKKNK